MEAPEPDATAEHGARIARNIREWWPNLTDQDLRALNTWRWHTISKEGNSDGNAEIQQGSSRGRLSFSLGEFVAAGRLPGQNGVPD